jgi:hypothetical protein
MTQTLSAAGKQSRRDGTTCSPARQCRVGVGYETSAGGTTQYPTVPQQPHSTRWDCALPSEGCESLGFNEYGNGTPLFALFAHFGHFFADARITYV